jgi:hypothetical protein
MKLLLKKEHDNTYDDEAIAVYTKLGNKIGYVANSVHSVCRGTDSAGRIYDKFEEEIECTVRFIAEEYGFSGDTWNWRTHPFIDLIIETCLDIQNALLSNWDSLPERIKENTKRFLIN